MLINYIYAQNVISPTDSGLNMKVKLHGVDGELIVDDCVQPQIFNLEQVIGSTT